MRLDIAKIRGHGIVASLVQGSARDEVDTHAEYTLQFISQIHKGKSEGIGLCGALIRSISRSK